MRPPLPGGRHPGEEMYSGVRQEVEQGWLHNEDIGGQRQKSSRE